MTPLINGIQHSWASIKIVVLGRTVTGITKISYDDNVEYANNYGAGNMPESRGVGNYEAKCTLEMYQHEVVGLQQSIAGKRLQEIDPFDIVVTYLPEGSAGVVVDTIKNCQFKTNGRDLNQGDTNSKVNLELIISHIKWHGQL